MSWLGRPGETAVVACLEGSGEAWEQQDEEHSM